MGEGGEKSRSDLRDGVRCAWAKPSLDAITTSNARMASGSPDTFPAPCARATRASAKQKSLDMVFFEGGMFSYVFNVSFVAR